MRTLFRRMEVHDDGSERWVAAWRIANSVAYLT